MRVRTLTAWTDNEKSGGESDHKAQLSAARDNPEVSHGCTDLFVRDQRARHQELRTTTTSTCTKTTNDEVESPETKKKHTRVRGDWAGLHQSKNKVRNAGLEKHTTEVPCILFCALLHTLVAHTSGSTVKCPVTQINLRQNRRDSSQKQLPPHSENTATTKPHDNCKFTTLSVALLTQHLTDNVMIKIVLSKHDSCHGNEWPAEVRPANTPQSEGAGR